jgi:hypothetical protein
MAILKKLLAVSVAFAATMITSCSTNTVNVDENSSGGTSAAAFKIAAAPNTPFAKIADSASLTITASDMNNFTQALKVTDSTVEGTVTGIPAGMGRLFTVSVFDSLDSIQYKGTATADLPRGATVNVPITLYRVGANAVINGKVVETGNSLPSVGLVAYYPFNGNTKDESGNGNNGSLNGATTTTDRFDKSNSAYFFDGQNDYITIGDSAVPHSLRQTVALTVSVWVNVSSYPGDSGVSSDIGPIVDMGYYDGAAGYIIAVDGRSSAHGGVRGGIHVVLDGLGNHSSVSSSEGTTATPIVLNKWAHILVCWAKGSPIQVYQNGQLMTQWSTFNDTISWNPLWHAFLGRHEKPETNQRWYHGKIDDIRIYNRALSASEIAALYHEGGWAGN